MKIRGQYGIRSWFRENFLTVITLAHTVKKLKQSAVRACMYAIHRLGLNPTFLSRVLPCVVNKYSIRPMVRTRSLARQDLQAESLRTIAGRLTQLPVKSHQPLSERLAAVLVPLFEDKQGTVRVWLTQRSQNLKSHKGDLAKQQD
jgi:hypothetical protein